ncbi:hypothetical protein PHYSODRAFT_323288 [Phytophthora sojae]|uniref:MULE transposase domain-containing protein n=1 Tax=Phytophthora sojae (strain P6497) TaxID=1094619 RepID=G4YN35_PHYSP|nr:hypothetical protein PHYSODRAFT_323288 [Phytophthora sojae]EGZ29830.1 hypothetical protein PHYSODRAFT_323288 [Phytophthora sojae]|eukprot:XP_009517105.1 hypothetical protein PHYSODRAFT_323288 [Phytophthora sojae]
MKREVDHLAVTTTATRSEIWEDVRSKFYRDQDVNCSYVGLSRDKVLRRVNRARAEAFGGSVYGQIESPPWSQQRERLIGWAHPVLLDMLKQNKTSIFLDGTFRCVPPKFKQCVVFTAYDRATKGYYPAAFVLCTSKYEMYFHAIRHVVDATDYSMNPEGSHPSLPEFVSGIKKLARKYANFKNDVEFGRASAPRRPPIALPKAVVLPDDDTSSDEEVKVEDTDDISERESQALVDSPMSEWFKPMSETIRNGKNICMVA